LTGNLTDVQWDRNLQRKISGGFQLENFGEVSSPIHSNAIYASPLVYSGGYADAYGDENLRAGYQNNVVITGGVAYVTNEQHLRNLNDQRSKIKIIDPAYITTFVEEFENILNA